MLLSETERAPPRLAAGRGFIGREGPFEEKCDVEGTRRSGPSPSKSRSMSSSSSIMPLSASSRVSLRFVFALEDEVNASFDAYTSLSASFADWNEADLVNGSLDVMRGMLGAPGAEGE